VLDVTFGRAGIDRIKDAVKCKAIWKVDTWKWV